MTSAQVAAFTAGAAFACAAVRAASCVVGRRAGASARVAHPKLAARADLRYPEGHWSRVVMPATADAFVAVLRVVGDDGEGREVLVLLKAGSCYSAVVALTDRSDPSTVLNKVPSQREIEAVTMAASQVAAAYLRAGLMPQLELLGNNSHELAGGVLQLGRAEEPSVPHVHVKGRGDPQHRYLGGVPLRGLPPWQVMVPRGPLESFGPGEADAVAADLCRLLCDEVPLHPSVSVAERKAGV
eukprot:TRINITY_DN11587_c0_g1_i1.p2 TRINITY_DN11587_c0_g1~~TRINITY_DN11587_c0_g1_i1.p2  ORF type:complete len:264 (+),score=97.52 TRINITY_DN11587_c0_g1_i1:72-794(+)